jgi:hypothetical protein
MRNENIWRVDFSKNRFKLWAQAKEEPTLARAVDIATGGKAKWHVVEGERRLMGKGVSGCAVRDAFFYRNGRVAVVGASARWPLLRRPRRMRWEKLGAAREKTREGSQEEPHSAASQV